MSLKENLVKVSEYVYMLPKNTIQGQKVPVYFYLSEKLLELLEEDAIKQAGNAGTLPGVEKAIYVMPDVHVGYGFPVGGIMATDVEEGIISPGSIGYDINCGVRLIATNLTVKDVQPVRKSLMERMLRNVPAGVGSTGKLKLSKEELSQVAVKGARWAVEKGFGFKEDLEHIESGGALPGADPDKVSDFAFMRGSEELGTVGSGNHFVEVQFVDEVYNPESAKRLGLELGRVTVMVHSGSRGFGHQVCVDYLKVAKDSLSKYGLDIPDMQLACMPFKSPEGQAYFKAMNCSANYAFANRQVLGYLATDTLREFFGLSWEDLGYKLVYDLAHNIGKVEKHKVDNELKTLLVHRKGATRAFPPHNPDVPSAYMDLGQPVLLPGDVGRYSFLLLGQERSMDMSFGSACHGAGRLMSRTKAKEFVKKEGLEKVLEGLVVVARGKGTVAEEIPQAYKDVSEVASVVHSLGIAKLVARFKPLGTLKG
ncbi:MAG: RtcB family protein [Aquificaceae bacterium]|nr:RtcB family protein [Aquificaceae bacterium]